MRCSAHLVPATSPAAGSARACLPVDAPPFTVGAPARVRVTAGEFFRAGMWRLGQGRPACEWAATASTRQTAKTAHADTTSLLSRFFHFMTPASHTTVLLCWCAPSAPGAPALLDVRVTAAGSPSTAADLVAAAASGAVLECKASPLADRPPAALSITLAGVSPDATQAGLAAALVGLPVEAGAIITPGGGGVEWKVLSVDPPGRVSRVTRRTVVHREC